MTTRVSKEPERPRRFHRQSGWGDRNRQLPGPRWDAHDRGEQTTGDTVVSAREDIERVETNGGESECPIVSLKRGNHPEGPRGEKGMPCHDTVGGTVSVHRCSCRFCSDLCARAGTFANGRPLALQATSPGFFP